MPTRILLATIGHSFQVVPEIVAALAPGRCPLYDQHPLPQALQRLRADCGVEDIDELWCIASGGSLPQLEIVEAWNRLLPKPLILRRWVVGETTRVDSDAEIERLRETIYRAALQASQTGQLICSLAGGRKTMSADLQRAASLVGCAGLLHIAAPEPLPPELRCTDPVFWTQPLSAELSAGLIPVFLGRHRRAEALDLSPAIHFKDYPQCGADDSLVAAIDQRINSAQQLLHNYLHELSESERLPNWRQLYRLPPADVERLRTTRLSAEHAELIRALPKAELHCHLGGLPTLEDQRLIGAAVWSHLAPVRRDLAISQVQAWLRSAWPEDWPQQLRAPGADRAARSAALLCNASDPSLQEALYPANVRRLGLATSMGFAAYERPGELSGSAVLGEQVALPSYADAVRRYSSRENLRYLELRGSPHKYAAEPALWLKWLADFRTALPDDPDCQYRFLWVADRRVPKQAAEIAETAVKALTQLPGFLVGIDLAGDETHSSESMQDLARSFVPVHRACLPITIHAGEGEAPENIWQAAYALHADRIGHGLTLPQKPELMTRFRNRGLALELCPTSNREVVGYFDPHIASSAGLENYPLRKLLDAGIAVTLNSDNPGISRTGLSHEFLTAARMVPISLWEALALSHQAFRHAFLDADERQTLIAKADHATFEAVAGWLEHTR